MLFVVLVLQSMLKRYYYGRLEDIYQEVCTPTYLYRSRTGPSHRERPQEHLLRRFYIASAQQARSHCMSWCHRHNCSSFLNLARRARFLLDILELAKGNTSVFPITLNCCITYYTPSHRAQLA